MTQPSDKEKLFARRKAYNELRRKIQERPGYSLVSPKDMTPFDRYMSDNLIAPPAVVDWGLCEFKNASPELLQLQSYHRQATSDEAKRKIAEKIIDLVGIKDSPVVSYLAYVLSKETDEARISQIHDQMRGGPVIIPIPDDPVAALEVLLQAERENGDW